MIAVRRLSRRFSGLDEEALNEISESSSQGSTHGSRHGSSMHGSSLHGSSIHGSSLHGSSMHGSSSHGPCDPSTPPLPTNTRPMNNNSLHNPANNSRRNIFRVGRRPSLPLSKTVSSPNLSSSSSSSPPSPPPSPQKPLPKSSEEEVIILRKTIKMLMGEAEKSSQQTQRTEICKVELANQCLELGAKLSQSARENKNLKAKNIKVIETRAEMEKFFMNQMNQLSTLLMDTERKYKNMVVDRDFKIAQLEEKVRKMQSKEFTLTEDDEAEEVFFESDLAKSRQKRNIVVKKLVDEEDYSDESDIAKKERRVRELEAELRASKAELESVQNGSDKTSSQKTKSKKKKNGANDENDEENFMSKLEDLQNDMAVELLELQKKWNLDLDLDLESSSTSGGTVSTSASSCSDMDLAEEDEEEEGNKQES